MIANAINWDGSDARIDEAWDSCNERLDRMQSDLFASLPGDIAILEAYLNPVL